MRSILRQLAKYQGTQINGAETNVQIEIKETTHPYRKIVEKLCDIIDPQHRKAVIGDALLALNGFVPPPMTNKLYPIESAILYHLFYHFKIVLCGESQTDRVFETFLKTVKSSKGGIETYMRTLRSSLDKSSTCIFLYRVMLAALGAHDRFSSKRDYIKKEFGIKAARMLGVEASARAASRGLDGLSGASVEQLILGRITYIAFWEWSQTAQADECGDYINQPLSSTQESGPNRRKPAALPPHQS